jgi:anti-sigma-K factor RskA
MNYEQAELREQLAGAYVLGTLRGPARARFERSCAASQSLGAAVRRWEDRLMPLLRGVVPVTPSTQVWEEISKRTSTRGAAATRRAVSWRWVLAGAVALSLLVTVSIRVLSPPLQVVAALGQDRLHPLWIISRSESSSALTIRALRNVQSNPQLAYELWALPRNGKAPVSLGLLPRSGSIERALSAPQRSALLNSNRLAVSLEPAGGSPTGSPTGPVLFVADVRQSS